MCTWVLPEPASASSRRPLVSLPEQAWQGALAKSLARASMSAVPVACAVEHHGHTSSVSTLVRAVAQACQQCQVCGPSSMVTIAAVAGHQHGHGMVMVMQSVRATRPFWLVFGLLEGFCSFGSTSAAGSTSLAFSECVLFCRSSRAPSALGDYCGIKTAASDRQHFY